LKGYDEVFRQMVTADVIGWQLIFLAILTSLFVNS